MLGALSSSIAVSDSLIGQEEKRAMKTDTPQGLDDRALLLTAIFTIRAGQLAGNAKVLLLYLGTIAEPRTWTVSVTQPEMADAIGTTVQELRERLWQLKVAGAVRIDARLFRGHKDARAVRMRDGGHVMALNAMRILRLARENEPAPRTRFMAVDARAQAQFEARARVLDEAIARLRRRSRPIAAVPKGD
jgi:hypothetical protein